MQNQKFTQLNVLISVPSEAVEISGILNHATLVEARPGILVIIADTDGDFPVDEDVREEEPLEEEEDFDDEYEEDYEREGGW